MIKARNLETNGGFFERSLPHRKPSGMAHSFASRRTPSTKSTSMISGLENKSNEKFLTRSHCQAWSAAPAYFLPFEILGIQSTSVGVRSVAVHPQPCGLTWARGSVPLPAKGRVDVSWSCANQHLSIRIVAPSDVQINVKIPEGYTRETDVQRISL